MSTSPTNTPPGTERRVAFAAWFLIGAVVIGAATAALTELRAALLVVVPVGIAFAVIAQRQAKAESASWWTVWSRGFRRRP